MNGGMAEIFSKWKDWKEKNREDWDSIRFFIVVAAIMFLVVRPFILQPFIVDGRSMAPTLNTSDYLLIDKVSYRFSEPKRGDVVVFLFPNPNNDPRYDNRYFIKRVIGLPGEEVKVEGDKTTIIGSDNREGFRLGEPYVKQHAENISVDRVLGPSEYFVMGDNRAESYDSRFWGGLDGKFVEGRSLLRLFPISKISIFPGEYAEYETNAEQN